MYALVKDGAILRYPYSITDLRRDNSGTSFPRFPSDDTLEAFGVVTVAEAERPTHDPVTQDLTELQPVLTDGVWVQVWAVTEVHADEIASRTEDRAQSVRAERGMRLQESDWIVIVHSEQGTPVPPEWMTYRQALREVTEQPGFPFDVVWPVKPE